MSISRHGVIGVGVAACVAMALSACSSSGSTAPHSSPASSATGASTSASGASTAASSPSSAAAAPTTAATHLSAAAKQYLALTAPVDSALQGFLRLPNSTSAHTADAAASRLARDESTLITKLKAVHWPAAAKPALANLEATATREQAVYAKCAHSGTVTQIKSTLTKNKATIAARVAAAQHVHAALEIPQNAS